MKKGYKILAGTWSLGEEKKYFDDLLSKGLDSDDIAGFKILDSDWYVPICC